jgi:hypothetical protein
VISFRPGCGSGRLKNQIRKTNTKVIDLFPKYDKVIFGKYQAFFAIS